MRILPVFGIGALDVSPRVGHVHITVDGASWHFVDASGETIILVGLTPGAHEVLVELADPTHRIVAKQLVRFDVPVPHRGSHDSVTPTNPAAARHAAGAIPGGA